MRNINRVVLFLSSLATCVVTASAAQPNPSEAKALAEIRKLYGEVTIDEKRPGHPVVKVRLESHWKGDESRITDKDLQCLEALTQLEELELAEVFDQGL